MKKVKTQIEFELFEKGDYVRTTDGVGVVTKDEILAITEEEIRNKKVSVQHKSGISGNVPNKELEMSKWNPRLITKDEYDEEEE